MYQLVRAIAAMVRNRPLIWLNEDGTVFDREQVGRRERWAITRPSWTYTFLTRQLPCGCGRRIRMAWYSSECADHWTPLEIA